MSDQKLEALKLARDVLEEFAYFNCHGQRGADNIDQKARDMPITRALSILNVWIEDIDELRDLRDFNFKRYGLSDSATSRLTSWWTDQSYRYTAPDGRTICCEGHQALEYRPDPFDGRRKRLVLTEKGAQFARALLATIEKFQTNAKETV